MIPFTTLSGIAAPLRAPNVDTDQIIPARFMKTVERSGLGQHLFADLARDPHFVLNRPEYAGTVIIIAGANFGCGSSREHASWALIDRGIRCVIAPNFADIFTNNALRNGVLPVSLPESICALLADDADHAPGTHLRVDLEHRLVVRSDGEEFAFDIDPLRRRMLLDGSDDIDLTLRHLSAISAFERNHAATEPWLA